MCVRPTAPIRSQRDRRHSEAGVTRPETRSGPDNDESMRPSVIFDMSALNGLAKDPDAVVIATRLGKPGVSPTDGNKPFGDRCDEQA